MPIHIPADHRSLQAQPLARCIAKAAHQMGTTEGFLELALVYVFDALVREVCKGSVVTIPGLGRFGARVLHPGKRGGVPYAIPAFAACRGYRHEVKWSLPPGQVKSLRRYRRRNAIAGVPGREAARSFWTLRLREKKLTARGRPEQD